MSPTCFLTRKVPRAVSRIIPAAIATTPYKGATCKAFMNILMAAFADFEESQNPQSTVYSGRMVELSKIHAYTWDARPYPAFPYDLEAWSDGANWFLGHWLNGRMAGGPLQAVIEGILRRLWF